MIINSMQVDNCSPRTFAQAFIESLKERAEHVPNAGQRVESGNVLKIGSDCTGLGSDFFAIKMLLGASAELKTAFMSDTWQLNFYFLFMFWVLVLILVFDFTFWR